MGGDGVGFELAQASYATVCEDGGVATDGSRSMHTG